VPTLYAADNLGAAALESIFHGVKHIPSPTLSRIGLKESCYSELAVNDDLVVVELVNPHSHYWYRGKPEESEPS